MYQKSIFHRRYRINSHNIIHVCNPDITRRDYQLLLSNTSTGVYFLFCVIENRLVLSKYYFDLSPQFYGNRIIVQIGVNLTFVPTYMIMTHCNKGKIC